jgi:hypothetical protein
MKKIPILIVAGSILFSACASGKEDLTLLPATPTVVPATPTLYPGTPIPEEFLEDTESGVPTIEPTQATLQLALHPSQARTGLAEIDRIIDALLLHDFPAIKDLTSYSNLPCRIVDGLGGPPRCEEGESEGTIVEAVPFLGPEGFHQRIADYESWSGPDVLGLLAVYRNSGEVWSDPNFPAGDYGLVFLLSRGIEVLTLQVTEGKIIRYDYKMGGINAEEIQTRSQEILLPLSYQSIPTSVPWGKYTDVQGRFRYLYPPSLELVQDGSLERWFLGDQISAEVLPFENSWITCFYKSVGDCPFVENDELVKVNGVDARKLSGYIGAVGGNIPQEFITYIFDLGDQALVLTVYALPFGTETVDIDQIWPLQGMYLDLFQRTVDTVKLTP